MTHDPMCPSVTACDCKHAECCFCDAEVWCQCDLIAKVREDTLNQARTLLQALACPMTESGGHCEECEQYREALACVESLRETR